MLTSKQFFIFLGILSLNTPLPAQITTDGTLGVKTNLAGPNFQIPDNLGQQFGGNLFHSFREFNINTGQSATFTGPNTVQNILTRVTGGQSSLIDGTLRSDIPNANLYLLNPSGILFGKNARLDISGAFYASTADGVNLGEGGKFLARSPNDSILTTAPPSAFGFWNSQPASIEIQGDTLTIRNHTYYAPNGQINVAADGNIRLEDSTLYAPNGQIRITTPGDLRIVQTSQKPFEINADGQSEMIANLDVSGLHGGGNITIRANSFVSEHGWMFADIWGDEGWQQEIDIRVNEKISLVKGAGITADNFSMGHRSGSITIEAKELQLEGTGEVVDAQTFFPTIIATNNYSSYGQGGNITLRHINTMSLTNDSSISASADSTGNAGRVLLEDIHNLTLNGGRILGYNTGGGNGGTINITADNISLFGGSYMSTSATEGKGSNINITAQRLYAIDSSIVTRTFSGNPQSGAGKFNFKGPKYSFVILDNSQILATAKAGPGGYVSITASQYLPSSDSVIDVSSEFNIDGQVLINTPGMNLNGILTGLPRAFSTLEISLLNRCTSFSKDNLSRFLITARDILPRGPEDWRTHSLRLLK